MLARIRSAALKGIEGLMVSVEVEAALGLPAWTTVGLPHRAVTEGKLRVRAAIQHCGVELPPRRVVVSLAPADVRKDGAAYDLPIALALLEAIGRLRLDRLDSFLVFGELALDGSLNPIRGALPLALAARSLGQRGVVMPGANAREAASAGVEVLAPRHLGDVVAFLDGTRELPSGNAGGTEAPDEEGRDLLADVRGQQTALYAMEVAAAGGHNLLLAGPPGCGKTMLARRLPRVLPPLSDAEALETTTIHSVAGLLSPDSGVMRRRPFRAPHHTASAAALIGGGADARPGEVSLAHNGVLFLDEAPELPRHALEALRQPLEDGLVSIVRANARTQYPARFMLVAAMNLCPCGAAGDRGQDCSCEQSSRQRYRNRLSAALRDRIDLQVPMDPLGPDELVGLLPQMETDDSGPVRESLTAQMRRRVLLAREVQMGRHASGAPRRNAALGPDDLARWCPLQPAARTTLVRALRHRRLSARTHIRLLRVARTVADLSGRGDIDVEAVETALELRRLDLAATDAARR